MKYGTFDRGGAWPREQIHHIAVDYRRALCSGSRLATITHDTGTPPHALSVRVCRPCIRAWEAGTDGEEFDLASGGDGL